MAQIKKIQDTTREAMKQKSAQSLPDVPSSKGWTPKKFKDSITKPMFDNDNSLFSEVNRVVEETNKEFEQFDLNKVSHEDAVHKTGFLKEVVTGEKTFETNDGTAPVHLKSSFPYVVSDTAGKVGMRAYTEDGEYQGEIAGQFAVSYNEEYGGHFANMQARDNEGTLHTLRVSKMGATYHTNKNGVSEKHNIPLDENVVHIDGRERIKGRKAFESGIDVLEVLSTSGSLDLASAYNTRLSVGDNEARLNGMKLATEDYAKTYTDSAIVKIIDNAPATLDTFKEIADYIASDKTGASQMTASINKNKQDIANNTNQINALENNKLDKEDLIYENVENAPEKINIVVRDTISADTYNEAREIQIGKDKFKFGSGSKIKANEFVDGTLPTLEYLNIDGNTYKLPNYVVDKSGLKLVAEGKTNKERSNQDTIVFDYNNNLERNKLYMFVIYNDDYGGDFCCIGKASTYLPMVWTNEGGYQWSACLNPQLDACYLSLTGTQYAISSVPDYDKLKIYEIPIGESAQVEKHNKTINALMQRVSDLEQKAGLTSVGYVQDNTLNLIRVNVVDDVLEVSGFKFDGEVMII